VPEAVSLTLAVQVDPWATDTEEGLQLMVVEVDRAVTVNEKPVASELVAWIESLAA
jgi:hypothetical protein